MPNTYENNGTTSTVIKNIYDNNGSSSTKIMNGFDNNGSASTKVFQSSVYLWNNGNTGYTVNTRTYLEGTAAASTFTVTGPPTSGAGSCGICYVTADFTPWSTLTVNYTYTAYTYNMGAVGYGTGATNFDVSSVNTAVLFANGASVGIPNSSTDGTPVTGTVTQTWNISNVSGNRQVIIWGAGRSSSYWARITLKVNSILLS